MNDTLRKMLTIQLPATTVQPDNPIYRLEIRRIRRLNTDANILRYVLILCIPFVVFPILIAVFAYTGQEYQRATIISNGTQLQVYATPGHYLRTIAATFTTAIFTVSVAGMAVGDLFSLIAAVIVSDFNRNDDYWDVLWLTGLQPRTIMVAKHAVGQTYAWRSTAWEIALRATVATLIAITTLSALVDSNDHHLFSGVASITSVGAFSLWLIYEPIWRMQTAVAVGLRIATRERNLVLLYAKVFVRAILMWFARIFIMLFVGFAFLNVLFLPGQASVWSDATTAITVIALCGVLFPITRSYYLRNADSAMYLATSYLFQRERKPHS